VLKLIKTATLISIMKNKMMNKKYVSGLLTALSITTVSLGSLLTITQSALATPAIFCKPGYVLREATPEDGVCVTPTVRNRTRRENAQAARFREPNGGAYGPDTCKQGYVWRETIPSDRVCVLPRIRAEAAEDNRQAESRRAQLVLIYDAPAISGEVVLTLPNPESTQCKDLKVHLASKEILPKPNDGGIHLDVPIFTYSQALSGDLKTGKCNYIIGATLGDIGKKAYLTFSRGSMSGSQPSNSLITVPRGLMKMNFETAFFYIN
jgi:hypothetical protein